MRPNLSALLPKDKTDTDKAEAVVALGYPVVEPILPALIEWMQDMNWPVARTLQPFLASIGRPLIPHVRRVLSTSDEIWKYGVLHGIVRESAELALELSPELERLARSPTPAERQEKLDELAKDVLDGIRGADA
jgi:hypothetical protein